MSADINNIKETGQKRPGDKKKKKNHLIHVFVSLKIPHVGVLHHKASGNPFGTDTYVAVTGGVLG